VDVYGALGRANHCRIRTLQIGDKPMVVVPGLAEGGFPRVRLYLRRAAFDWIGKIIWAVSGCAHESFGELAR
jgi:hypothetical protein